MKLTIDAKVQTIIERELDNAAAKYNPDGMIAVAMNPKTGKCLACQAVLILIRLTINRWIRPFTTGTCRYGAHMNRVRPLRLLRLRRLSKSKSKLAKRPLL